MRSDRQLAGMRIEEQALMKEDAASKRRLENLPLRLLYNSGEAGWHEASSRTVWRSDLVQDLKSQIEDIKTRRWST